MSSYDDFQKVELLRLIEKYNNNNKTVSDGQNVIDFYKNVKDFYKVKDDEDEILPTVIGETVMSKIDQINKEVSNKRRKILTKRSSVGGSKKRKSRKRKSKRHKSRRHKRRKSKRIKSRRHKRH